MPFSIRDKLRTMSTATICTVATHGVCRNQMIQNVRLLAGPTNNGGQAFAPRSRERSATGDGGGTRADTKARHAVE